MQPQSAGGLPEKISPALEALLEAFQYASELQTDRWLLSLTLSELREHGLNHSDIRYLILKGLIEHSVDIGAANERGRFHRSTRDLVFSEESRFSLTDNGFDFANAGIADRSPGEANGHKWEASKAIAVHWEPDRRLLTVDGVVAKRFKWPAVNQEAVLAAFQEEDWPSRIDDPLPPQGGQDPKRRLADTIKCLNRNQEVALIRFRGDGTGEGVIWDVVRPHDEANM